MDSNSYTVYYRNYWVLKLILKVDQTATNIGDKDRNMTTLHLAAGRGDARMVEGILSLPPECYELVDNRGWNFLHYAVLSFEVEELRKLLEKN